jgi:hypothetical protein
MRPFFQRAAQKVAHEELTKALSAIDATEMKGVIGMAQSKVINKMVDKFQSVVLQEAAKNGARTRCGDRSIDACQRPRKCGRTC